MVPGSQSLSSTQAKPGVEARQRTVTTTKLRILVSLEWELAETEGDERQILKRGNSRLYR
jgi:hypothetical protein